MAKSRKPQAKADRANSPQPRSEPIKAEEKIARMLAVLALQGTKGRVEQAEMLRIGGFTRREMAELLDTSENGVSVLLYQAKQKKAKKVNGAD